MVGTLMDLRRTITLAPQQRKRCWDYAEQLVSDYADPHFRGVQASLDVSYGGAEKNIKLQAHAKMAELAFALAVGLSDADVRFARGPDPGYDINHNGIRWDVKHVLPSRRFLIWSKNKTAMFESKLFDNFAVVMGEEPDFSFIKWTTKKFFAHNHKIADDAHVLATGTWYMHLDELTDSHDGLMED